MNKSNTTSIVKDIFIFSTKDVQKTPKKTWTWKSADTAKPSSNFEKKVSECLSQINSRAGEGTGGKGEGESSEIEIRKDQENLKAS